MTERKLRLAITRNRGNILFNRWTYAIEEDKQYQGLEDTWVTLHWGYTCTELKAKENGLFILYWFRNGGKKKPEVEYIYG